MGIDIYARWAGQTEPEEKAQYTGFNTHAGDVGYLREAYHGAPYATRALMPEAFERDDEDGVPITAAVLAERLPNVLEIVAARQRKLYDATDDDVALACKAFADFVALCERKEVETGQPVRILASY
jgi:hypothetical protein